MKKEVHSPKDEVSFNTKSTPDWYENFIDYYIDRALNADGQRKAIIEEQYSYVSHDISDSKYKEVINSLQADLTPEKLKEFKVVKQEFNLVLRIVKKYVGEYITRYSNFQVYTEDGDAVGTRNGLIAAKVMDVAFQKFVNGLNEQGVPTGMPSEELPDINEIIKEETQKFIDEKAIKAKHRIELLKKLCDFTYKLSQLAYFYVVTDNICTYLYNLENDTFFDIVPPHELYCLTSTTGFIEDSPVVVRKYRMRLHDILEQHGNLMTLNTKKQLKELVYLYETTSGEFNGTIDISQHPGIISNRLESLRQTHFEFTDNHLETDVYHLQAVSKKKIGKLTYLNLEINKVEEKEVSEDYIFDSAFGDIEIKWSFIDCFYEGWRFGNDTNLAVYTKVKELDVQREHLSIKSFLKNSYYGTTNILPVLPLKPLPGRIVNYQIEYEIIRLKRKQIIAKFKPYLQYLPESILSDSAEFTLEERFSKMVSDDMLILNDTDLSQQAVTALQMSFRSTVEKYLDSLTNIMKSIEMEALDEAEMNPVRYGNASPYMSSELANKQENYATIGNVLAINTYSQVIVNILEAMIDYTKIAWIDGRRGVIQTPDGKLVEVVVDGIENFNDNVGIFIKDVAGETQKLQQVKQMALSASQNGDIESMTELIVNDDLLSIKEKVKEFTQKNREFQLQLEGIKKEAEEIKRTAQAEKYKAERENLLIKEDAETKRQDSRNQVDLIINGVSTMLNNSNDGSEQQQNDLDFKKRQHNDNMRLKEETLRTNERIANANKN